MVQSAKSLSSGKIDHLMKVDRDSHLHPFTSILDQKTKRGLLVDKASGITISDSDGKEYFDAAAGLWCVNVGYGRRQISEAMFEQSLKLPYYHSFNAVSNEPSVRLSARILEKAPSNMRRVFYGSSGSDANDTAIKIVWHYNICRGKPEKRKFISRHYGYHGVSVAAGSLTGVPMVHENFGLPLDFARHVSRPDLYRDAPARGAKDEADYSKMLADEIEQKIIQEGSETVAAFVAEPVMGTGGVFPPPEGYFEAVKAVLDRHDVLLIADEVITGFGRLGDWFATNYYGYEADLIITAKGLTSGYQPLSAVILGDKVWRVIEDSSNDARIFAHGFTYSGHPVCAAAAMANLDIIEDEGLIGRVADLSPVFHARIGDAMVGSPIVGDIRAVGLMLGIELVSDLGEKAAFPASAKVAARVSLAARNEGILIRALPNSDVLAMSPPFVISESEIDTIAARLRAAIDKTVSELHAEGLLKD